MKHFLVLCLAFAVAMAVPADVVEILRADTSLDSNGYSFTYEQTDGQKREETGVVKNAGQEDEFVAVRGSFQYTGPDGQTYTVTYTADENGYRPEASHLPVA